MSIADIKYKIVPDQLIMLLVITAIGYIPHHDGGPVEGLWGMLIGLGVMLLMAGLGKLIYKKDTIGGGDIKLFAALGLCMGIDGIIAVFILTTLISAAHFCLLLVRKKIKAHEKRPMVPYLSLIHISEPTRQAEISYAVFCLKKKKKKKRNRKMTR